jgi:hypothetical protein
MFSFGGLSVPTQRRPQRSVQRLMPIRKTTQHRKFGYNPGDPCIRQLLLRQWLGMELSNIPTAAITGKAVDMILFPEDIRFLEKWLSKGGSAEGLQNALYPMGVTAESLNQLLTDGYSFGLYQAKSYGEHLKPLMSDEKLTEIGLYVGTLGHIFSVLVSKEGNVVTDITIMNTVLYPIGYTSLDTVRERFGIVKVLLYAVDPVNTFVDLMNRCHHVHSNLVNTPQYIQSREDVGYCQHWDTFFLYNTMVVGMEPRDVFERVMGVEWGAREEMIMQFANDVAQSAQIKSYTLSSTPSSVAINLPDQPQTTSEIYYDNDESAT